MNYARRQQYRRLSHAPMAAAVATDLRPRHSLNSHRHRSDAGPGRFARGPQSFQETTGSGFAEFSRYPCWSSNGLPALDRLTEPPAAIV